jgi:RND family efflux transporter MFP subunit
MQHYRKRMIRALAATWLSALAMTSADAQTGLAMTVAVYEAAPRERIWDGTVEATNQATVSAQTSGRVAQIFYDVDDFVEAGSEIMRFTDTEQVAALRQAQAAAAEAQARFDAADSEFQRVESMFQNQTVSRARFDQARADLEAATARLDAVRSTVVTAQQQLDYTKVRAPYAGIVSQRHVRVGELVQPGQPLMSGLSLASLRVNVDVPQSLIDPIRTIGAAFVYAGDQRIPAESLTFFPVADPVTNTFRVRVILPEASATLYPGTFVKVGFVVGEEQRLLVPTRAIVRRSELTAVYVVEGATVSLRQVRIGQRYGDRTEILAGLRAGEAVADDPISAGIYMKEHVASGDTDGR